MIRTELGVLLLLSLCSKDCRAILSPCVPTGRVSVLLRQMLSTLTSSPSAPGPAPPNQGARGVRVEVSGSFRLRLQGVGLKGWGFWGAALKV